MESNREKAHIETNKQGMQNKKQKKSLIRDQSVSQWDHTKLRIGDSCTHTRTHTNTTFSRALSVSRFLSRPSIRSFVRSCVGAHGI